MFDYTFNKLKEHFSDIEIKKANRLARKEGFNRATEIVYGNDNKVIDYTQFGYRKKTTDEYVPNAYRNNFGWKNTYYQKAKCKVMIMYYEKHAKKQLTV